MNGISSMAVAGQGYQGAWSMAQTIVRFVLAAWLVASAGIQPLAAQTCGVLPSIIFHNGAEADDPLVFPDVRPVDLPDPATPLGLSLDAEAEPWIAAGSIHLSGTIAGPPGTAVTLDGRPARMEAGRWWLPFVALDPGANALMIVAATPGGERQELSVMVTSDEASAPLPRIEFERADAFVPAEVAIRLLLPADSKVTEVRADLNGNGELDYLGPPTDVAMAVRIFQPGVYTTTVTLIEPGSPDVVLEAPIVLPRLGMTRVTLCHSFSEMRQSLLAGDIDGALDFVHAELHDFYRAMWIEMGDDLPAAAAALGEVVDGTLGFNDAELIVAREEDGVLYGYPVQLSRDRDGIWKFSGL
jgi:hypothetical protein